jgi:hypothetical protein
MQITVSKDKDKSRQITVDYPIGKTLQENVELHGEEAVNRVFQQKAKVAVADTVRPMLKADKPDKEIHEKVAQIKLGERQTRAKKSPKEKALADYDKMTPEQQKEYLEELKKRAGLK